MIHDGCRRGCSFPAFLWPEASEYPRARLAGRAPNHLNWANPQTDRIPRQVARTEVEPEMTLQFAVLGSGSRGNSTLVGHADGPGLLIDVGLGPRAIDQRLQSVGSDWSRIAAVVLTHTHGDHVESSTLQAMVKRRIALYCHEGHRDVLDADAGFQELERLDLIRFYDGEPFLASCGFRV